MDHPYFRWPGPPFTLDQVSRPAETAQWVDGVTMTRTSWAEVPRHGGGVNAAFVDGHVRWLPADEFLRVETDGRGFWWYAYAVADR